MLRMTEERMLLSGLPVLKEELSFVPAESSSPSRAVTATAKKSSLRAPKLTIASSGLRPNSVAP